MEKKEITNGEINFTQGGYCEGFYLNHSCDEWIIGDLWQAKKFAEDLLKTIKEVEEYYIEFPKKIEITEKL